MEAVSQIPKSELEAMGRWLVNLAQQEGILEFKVLAAEDIPEIKHIPEIKRLFNEPSTLL